MVVIGVTHIIGDSDGVWTMSLASCNSVHNSLPTSGSSLAGLQQPGVALSYRPYSAGV